MNVGRWSKEEDATLINMRRENCTAKEIAEILNRKIDSVDNRVRMLGLPPRKNVDEEFFLRNDEYSNYILGYWVADGCIMKKSGGHYFSIVSKDKEHLLNMKDIMNIKTKLYNNSYGTHEIRVGNKRLVESLLELGGNYNKTFTASLDNISYGSGHFRHFLRGYFDGDGSIILSNHVKRDGLRSISAISFTGGGKLIKSVKKHVGLECSLHKDKRKSDAYQLYYYGDEMRELLEFMYLDNNIALDRKHNAYLSREVKN